MKHNKTKVKMLFIESMIAKKQNELAMVQAELDKPNRLQSTLEYTKFGLLYELDKLQDDLSECKLRGIS